MSDSRIALQLYTVRDETARDFAGTLRKVAEIGYTAVEFAGYGGLSSQEMKELLRETGLQAVSTHLGLHALEQDLEKEMAYCLEIGCPFLIVPWLTPEYRNPEALRALAPRFNEFGQRCKEHGLEFGYHNHDFEFTRSDEGEFLFDNLLNATEPDLVKIELDTYWAAYAGVDPITYLRQQGARAALIHLKDMTPQRTFTEVGDGTLDIKGICVAAQEIGARFYVVENDAPAIASLESVERSLKNLQQIL